jgi:hypothetical protein
MLLTGLSLIILGCIAWYVQERDFNSPGVILSIMIILLGGSLFLSNLNALFKYFNIQDHHHENQLIHTPSLSLNLNLLKKKP